MNTHTHTHTHTHTCERTHISEIFESEKLKSIEVPSGRHAGVHTCWRFSPQGWSWKCFLWWVCLALPVLTAVILEKFGHSSNRGCLGNTLRALNLNLWPITGLQGETVALASFTLLHYSATWVTYLLVALGTCKRMHKLSLRQNLKMAQCNFRRITEGKALALWNPTSEWRNVWKRKGSEISKCLQITTPSKRYLEFGYLQTKPFYREPWFLVALAAASIVIIIMVVAILCVKSKSYKYKGEQTCM